jgi:hypothetical protein
MREAPDGVHR